MFLSLFSQILSAHSERLNLQVWLLDGPGVSGFNYNAACGWNFALSDCFRHDLAIAHLAV